ncbi:LysR family transcriptional regulator [Streptomyces sp. NPDC002018]|uniref:LysR family transcriptional regulator n=1 Tax=Streptomyces sp. NPDC002018 TaxID=3364629 RepID=UPI00368F9D10
MDRLETRELSYFVAVAQELHFSRAAQRLGISQPPLSRAISRLERRMGVPLFERTSRRVHLTTAGEVFLAESLKALDAIDHAVATAQRAHGSTPLRIATNPGTGSGVLRDLVTGYSRLPFGAPVEMVFTRDQAGALRAGEADVALLCASDDLTGLDTMEVAVEAPVVLLPAGHRLAGRATVTVADLRDEETFDADCPVVALDELVDLVAVGQLIAVVGESAADRTGSTVVAVPVADLPDTDLLLAWPGGAAVPSAEVFIRAAGNPVTGRGSAVS